MSDHKYFKKPISKSRGGNPRDLAPIRISWDTLNSEYAPRKNALVAPSVGIFDAPYGCVKVNKQWLSHVAGMIAVLLELDAWTGDDDGYVARQEIYKLLAALEADCEDIPVPCCDDLIIEVQNVKNEVTNIRNTINYNNYDTANIVNNYTTLTTTYNNSLDVVFDLAPNNKVPSQTGDKAICQAVDDFIDTLAAAGITAFQNEGFVFGAIGGIAGFIAAVASLAGTGGLSAPVAIPAAVAAISGVISIVNGAELLLWQDKDILEEIKCCMYKNLKGQEPDLALFTVSLDGCDDMSNGALNVGSVMNTTLKSDPEGFHATFLQNLDYAYNLAQVGLAGNCASCCASEPFAMSHNVSGGNVAFPTPLVVTGGAYSATFDDWSVVGPSGQISLVWEFDECVELNYIRIDRWFNSPQLSRTSFRIYRSNGSEELASSNDSPTSAPTPYEWNGFVDKVTKLEIIISGTAGVAYYGFRYVEVS